MHNEIIGNIFSKKIKTKLVAENGSNCQPGFNCIKLTIKSFIIVCSQIILFPKKKKRKTLRRSQVCIPGRRLSPRFDPVQSRIFVPWFASCWMLTSFPLLCFCPNFLYVFSVSDFVKMISKNWSDKTGSWACGRQNRAEMLKKEVVDKLVVS